MQCNQMKKLDDVIRTIISMKAIALIAHLGSPPWSHKIKINLGWLKINTRRQQWNANFEINEMLSIFVGCKKKSTAGEISAEICYIVNNGKFRLNFHYVLWSCTAYIYSRIIHNMGEVSIRTNYYIGAHTHSNLCDI